MYCVDMVSERQAPACPRRGAAGGRLLPAAKGGRMAARAPPRQAPKQTRATDGAAPALRRACLRAALPLRKGPGTDDRRGN